MAASAAGVVGGLLTSFSPDGTLLAASFGDGRIKVWDTVKGHLHAEFADIPLSGESGELIGAKRGHLSLDYSCMKWVWLESKKKHKAAGSLIVLGTGSGDMLALDVAAGEWRWKVGDCHPGGVTSVAYSQHCIYTAGADGMVCKIKTSTGNVLERFSSSSKAVSSLSVSPDGLIFAAASGRLKTFNCSTGEKIEKFSGHPVACRCLIFSEDGKHVLSSGMGERYIAVWKSGCGKANGATSILSMEHPAIFLDCKVDETSEDDRAVQVLAISEVGVCYLWFAKTFDKLGSSKPTKIKFSDSSKQNKGSTIFAASLLGAAKSTVGNVLVVYGSIVKPFFEKLTVHHGADVNLDMPENDILFPKISFSHREQVGGWRVTALDQSNAEDAVLPLPKVYSHEKKRKHGSTNHSAGVDGVSGDASGATTKLPNKWVPLHKDEDDLCIEDKLREWGIIDASDDRNMDALPGASSKFWLQVCNTINTSTNQGAIARKIRAHVIAMSQVEACELFVNLVSVWKSRSVLSEHILSWVYRLLVFHGNNLITQKLSSKALDDLKKMAEARCVVSEDLQKLAGRLQLMLAQIDMVSGHGSDTPMDEFQDHHEARESEDDDEESDDVDEVIYGNEDYSSDNSGSIDDGAE